MTEERRPYMVTKAGADLLNTLCRVVPKVRGPGVSFGPGGFTISPPMPAQRSPIQRDFDLTPVTLEKTSGSDGTTSAAPTWVYTATGFDGTEIETGLSPAMNRPKGKTMIATRGWLRFTEGEWELWDCDEKPNTAAC